MNEIHAEPPSPQHQETVATSRNGRNIKKRSLWHQRPKVSAFLLNTLSVGKSCLVAPGVASTALSYRNSVITPGWRLMRAGYRTCFHTLYDKNIYIYIYMCVCVCVCVIYHHHHHVALVALISLTLSRHSSLSFIALGRSSGQHPVSSHSCWMYVRAGRPAFARPCVGVHKSTSLMSSSLLLQQCPACLVRVYISSFLDIVTISFNHIRPSAVWSYLLITKTFEIVDKY